MTEKDINIASRFKQRLAGIVSLVDYRVFGSRARGDADECSDMDVFIEVEHLDKSLKDRILDIAWEVGFEYCMLIAPLIFSRDELENSPIRSSSIVKAIVAEGVAV